MNEKIKAGTVLNVLLLEDSARDFQIIREQLIDAGYILNLSRVDKKSEFKSSLCNNKFDIILADFKLPDFDAFEALHLCNEICPNVPFICISESIGEETAIELIKQGAVDYVLKDRQKKLPFSIKRALEETKKIEARRQTEKELRDSEQNYRTLVDSGKALIWAAGTDKLCNYFNRVWIEFTGRTLEQEMGNGWTESVHPDDLQSCLEIYTEAFDRREKFSMEYRLRRYDGEYRWIIDESCPRFDSKGGFTGYIGHCLDITERKQAEEKLAQEQYLMHALINYIPDNIYFKDRASRFIRISKALAKLFGLNDPSEVEGKTDFDFFTEEHARQAYEDEQEIIRTGQPLIKEEKETWADRPDTWVSTSKLPLRDKEGNIIGTFGISMDITRRKNDELLLKEKNQEIEARNREYEQLNEELQQINEELQRAKERAEESDRLKTAFLHNISHEIRTPMNAIVGFCGFLNERSLSSKNRKHFTDMIVQNSNQLLSIITDIINIAAVETGQEKIQEKDININEICKLVHEQFSSIAQKKNITLRYKTTLSNDEANIKSDETKLLQVLNNIVGNALKFTLQGYVDFGYHVKDNHIEFYVEDTGIGIPKEMHEEIFKRFRQVESTVTRQFGGSGLGLSISKAYIELFGGKIWLESELNEGSTFYFTVPYKKVHKNALSEQRSINKLKIEIKEAKTLLIAEDEDSNFMLLKVILSGLNFKIIRAINGLEAIEICKTNQGIDLVLMDMKMPVMNGYEATKQIKGFMPDVPIIAQTAYITDVDKNKVFACGCNDFIIKPFKKELLISKIKEQLMK